MDYQAHFKGHLRITILRLLQEAPPRRLNAAVLREAAELFGFPATRDQVVSELTWLAEQGLVANEDLNGLVVSTLLERGEDVALGRVVVPGIQRPSPRA